VAQVFITFIHEEETIAIVVQQFIRDVLGEDVTPFMSSDTSTVYAGERWMDRITKELKDARVVVTMLSQESVKRPWVNFEAGAAWIRDSALIPVCFNGLTKDTLRKPYSSLQALDLTNADDQHYLVHSVAHYLDLPPPPSRHWSLVGTPESEAPYEKLSFALKTLL
jgi:TIR domain